MIKTVAILGDSLTKHGYDINQSGWLAQLSDTFAGQIDFLNRGLSGYTVPMYLDSLPNILATLPSHLDLCIVFLGTNDTSILPSKQHVPFPHFQKAFVKLIELLQLHYPILVLTPTRCFPSLDINDPSSSSQYHVDSLHGAMATWLEKTDEFQCDVLNLYHPLSLLKDDEDTKNWFALDGLHLGPLMNAFIYQEVSKYLKSRFELKALGPSYKEVLGIE